MGCAESGPSIPLIPMLLIGGPSGRASATDPALSIRPAIYWSAGLMGHGVRICGTGSPSRECARQWNEPPPIRGGLPWRRSPARESSREPLQLCAGTGDIPLAGKSGGDRDHTLRRVSEVSRNRHGLLIL